MRDKVKVFAEQAIHVIFTFAIIAVPLFYIYGSGTGYFFSIYDIFKEVLIQSVALLMLGFFSLRLLVDPDFRFKKIKIYIPLSLFFLTMLISFAQMINPYEGFIFLKRWTSYFVILFVITQTLGRKSQIYYYVNWFITITTIVACYGILQFMGIDFPFLVQNFTGNATDGNPNFTGQYVGTVFPLAIALMLGNVSRNRGLLYLVASLIMGVFILLNRTKGVWIGAAASSLFLVGYFLFMYFVQKTKFHVASNERKLFKEVFRFFLIFLAASVFVSGLSFIKPLRDKVPPLFKINRIVYKVITEFDQFDSMLKVLTPQEKIDLKEIHYGDTTMQRVIIWQNTLKMISEQPITGVGLGNYKIAYQPYRTKKEQIATGPNVFVRRTHNEYLQLWSELGLFGIFFFLLIQLFLYSMAHRLWVRLNSFEDQCLVAGFTGGFMTIFITAFFGFALQNPNPSFTLWSLVGIFSTFYWLLWHGEALKNTVWESRLSIPQLIPSETLKLFYRPFEKFPDTFLLPRTFRLILSPLLVAFFIFGLVSHYWVWKPAIAFYYRQYGQALSKMSLHEKAKILFERSLKNEYPSWETQFLLANEYAEMNQFDEAVKWHVSSLKLNPYHAKGHYNLANTYHKMKDTEKATHHFEKAVLYDFMLYQAHTNLGAMYFLQKNYDKSIEYYKNAIEINPKFFSAYYNIAFAHFVRGEIGKSIQFIKQAKAIDPENAKLKDLENKIIDQMDKIQKTEQQDKNRLFQSNMNLGVMHYMKQEYEKGIPYYQNAVKMKPDFFPALYNVAFGYYALGQIGNAVPYLREAKRLEPENQQVLDLEKNIVRIVNQIREKQRQQEQQAQKA